MNPKSLRTRLRRLEKQSGLGSFDKYLAAMSDDELEAYLAAGMLLIEGDMQGAINCVAEILSLTKEAAKALIARWEAVSSRPSQFDAMSDEQLKDWIRAAEAELANGYGA